MRVLIILLLTLSLSLPVFSAQFEKYTGDLKVDSIQNDSRDNDVLDQRQFYLLSDVGRLSFLVAQAGLNEPYSTSRTCWYSHSGDGRGVSSSIESRSRPHESL